MKKFFFITLCCLLVSVLYSQSITTATNLNDKLFRVGFSESMNTTTICYLKYEIRNDSLVSIDDSAIKDSIFKKNIQDFYKSNRGNVSWKSILNGQGSCSKTITVVHPVFILSDHGKGVEYGTDITFEDFYKMFFTKLFGNKLNAYVMIAPLRINFSDHVD